jgi:hypothetical protein
MKAIFLRLLVFLIIPVKSLASLKVFVFLLLVIGSKIKLMELLKELPIVLEVLFFAIIMDHNDIHNVILLVVLLS